MPASPKRILIVKLSSLGDVVHALPVLKGLRTAYPDAHLAWAVEEKFSEVLEDHPDLDEVIKVRTQDWRRRWNLSTLQEISDLIARLRSNQYDLVLDLQGLIKSGLLTGATGAPLRIGFHQEDCRESLSGWFTNKKALPTRDIPHVVDKNLALLHTLDLPEHDTGFSLPPTTQSAADIESWLQAHPQLQPDSLVALHAGVGYLTKAWPGDRYAALADRLARDCGASIVLTWGPADRELAEKIGSLMTEPFVLGPETRSLKQAIALYRRLRLFISGDTGPLHLCAALGVPTVSVFGPTDPARNGPYGNVHKVVLKPQPCSFCFKRICPTENECMTAVQVDDMFAAAQEQLQLFLKPVAAP